MRWVLGLIVVVGLAVAGAWMSGSRAPVDEVAIAEARTGLALDSRRIDTGDVTLHMVFAGPEDGEPVILLHGFPEFWFVWHKQIAALAAAGYRVVAPDLRGTNRSDKPKDPAGYTSRAHADDIAALMDVLGWDSAYVAGHDVGAGVTWRLIFEHPSRVRGAVVFNIGHPMAWVEPSDDEESISWFRDFFKLPFVPELAARTGDWWLIAQNLEDTSRPGTFTDEELAIYKSAWARDNAFSTMLNAYRAPSVPMAPLPEGGVPAMPVALYYGMKDAFIPMESILRTREFIGADNVHIVDGAGHWLLLEEPQLTADAMIAAFSGREDAVEEPAQEGAAEDAGALDTQDPSAGDTDEEAAEAASEPTPAD